MAKKAFLVGFAIQTRVIVDIPEGFDPNNVNLLNLDDIKSYDAIISAAQEKTAANLAGYINEYNIYTLEEDLECPYDPEDPHDNPAAGNPAEIISKIVAKHGQNGFLALEKLETKVNDIRWTFTFDDNSCETLTLSCIGAYGGGKIAFHWTAPGYEVTDTLEDIERERLNYVLEELSSLL